MGCSFRDSADNLSFSIVGLAYNPDYKEKYFYEYYDTSLYANRWCFVWVYFRERIIIWPKLLLLSFSFQKRPLWWKLQTLAHLPVPYLTWLQLDLSALMSVLQGILFSYLANPGLTKYGKSVSKGVGFSAASPRASAQPLTCTPQQVKNWPPPLSLFFLFVPLYLSLFCFGKFEIETKAAGKTQRTKPAQDPDVVDG